jgi:hypothetical protein
MKSETFSPVDMAKNIPVFQKKELEIYNNNGYYY